MMSGVYIYNIAIVLSTKSDVFKTIPKVTAKKPFYGCKNTPISDVRQFWGRR